MCVTAILVQRGFAIVGVGDAVNPRIAAENTIEQRSQEIPKEKTLVIRLIIFPLPPVGSSFTRLLGAA